MLSLSCVADCLALVFVWILAAFDIELCRPSLAVKSETFARVEVITMTLTKTSMMFLRRGVREVSLGD